MHPTPLRWLACLSIPFAAAFGFAQAPLPDAAPASQVPPKAAPSLNAGDKAPPLAVEAFLKGAPITALEPGTTYVVEFWATWCGPCIAAMPHLSEVQAQFKSSNVSVIGINIWEDKEYSDATLPKVRQFVEKKGDTMAYSVAYDGAAKKTDSAWMKAAGRDGIPTTFVVDPNGIIAWIGHPMSLDHVLDAVLKKTWDIAEGPKQLKLARESLLAACKKYMDNYDQGEQAWADVAKAYPLLAPGFESKRYGYMVDGGHQDQAYKVGRDLFERARAKRNSAEMMSVVLPMTEMRGKPNEAGRQLASEVAHAVFELGDPNDPGRYINMVQIHLMLGNRDEVEKNKAKAIELIPVESKNSLIRWLGELEEAAAKK